MSDRIEVDATRQWVNNVVVGLNLCPFAKREFMNDKLRFAVTDSTTIERLLEDLLDELNLLCCQAEIETTLLIHPQVLVDFFDFNDFLAAANDLIVDREFEGIFQLASFHPNYQFAGVDENDASNYTNRSPYPMIHILREESLSRTIDAYPDVDAIPERNVALMREMGGSKLRELLRSCDKTY
ncbi:MAG: DUF1415 domain-containing protein [Pseudomonadota bacterium]